MIMSISDREELFLKFVFIWSLGRSLFQLKKFIDDIALFSILRFEIDLMTDILFVETGHEQRSLVFFFVGFRWISIRIVFW